ncbi:MAG: isoleucine--tRNA ligase [Candidatus Omnitrophica bacterium]|nr:isoleucine--tRNA ligase [Candidatus Omnitrophota bacterium]MBU1923802.1 isoleucine--tRNA ligase [Candidatus Omnitrophota bacterium]
MKSNSRSTDSEYKHTLNLPKTDFPMKADLYKREPFLLQNWIEKGIYKLISAKTDSRPKYILHDGPPYANGDIHIGHALNKVLKDIIVKYKTLRGFSSNYVPGWDCHGLPIEHQLFKELKIHKSQISQLEFRKKAYAYANKYIDTQKEQFKRLGVFADWENPYLTLSHDYEQSILNSLAELNEKGYVYRGLKPVNWCFRCETALAEAEVEYEDHSSPSIYVKFRLSSDRNFLPDSFLVIWTTTPWTLLANVAVAVHPEFSYVYINTEKGSLIVAKDLLSSFLTNAGIEKYSVIRELKGRQLEGLLYAHPFVSRNGRVVLADYVSREEGTGLVHTAPGHGNEDYFTGVKYKLDIIMPVDAKGVFDSTTGQFQGMHVYDANKPILEKLEKLGVLLFNSSLQHSYPHCWRCKSPVIFRATKQWFLNMEHNDLRSRLHKEICENVKWFPPGGQERISAMVSLRPDWCLSRQRYWGVPIPALICNNCQEEFLLSRVIRNFAALCAKKGSDCWFELPIEDFLPADICCLHCKGKSFSKGVDILDVWFDSGVSSQAVLKRRKELKFPASLYLEGSDQHRGWFQSSLISSMCIDNQSPFESVLTHGFVVDGSGRKMSKSLGNVISPFEIIKDYGADILRMWVASSDYNEDIRISPVILSRLSEAYRKIRNTARFILSNLFDFNPDTDKSSYLNFRKIDRWILGRVNSLCDTVDRAYATFEFHKAYKSIYDFCNEDLSMYYLDMVKGRLYTYKADSPQRRASQTALYEVLNRLVRIISPILVFTAEEIWQSMPKEKNNSQILSVHLLSWPESYLLDEEDKFIEELLKPVIGLIPEAARALEEMRNLGQIGSSFDAQINILTKTQDRYTFLQSFNDELFEIFKVSQVELTLDVDNESESFIKVARAGGQKCLRCWNYSRQLGRDKEHPLICDNCLKAIGGKVN